MDGCLPFQGYGRRAQAAQLSAWPEFLQQLSAASRPPLRCRARAASGDRSLWPDTASAPEDTPNTQLFNSQPLNLFTQFQSFINKCLFNYLCA